MTERAYGFKYKRETGDNWRTAADIAKLMRHDIDALVRGGDAAGQAGALLVDR